MEILLFLSYGWLGDVYWFRKEIQPAIKERKGNRIPSFISLWLDLLGNEGLIINDRAKHKRWKIKERKKATPLPPRTSWRWADSLSFVFYFFLFFHLLNPPIVIKHRNHPADSKWKKKEIEDGREIESSQDGFDRSLLSYGLLIRRWTRLMCGGSMKTIRKEWLAAQ